jgi:hypothetical protein
MTETPAEAALPAHVPYIPAGEPGHPLPPQFGPRPGWLRQAEIDRQIETLVARLLRRVGNLGLSVGNGVLEMDKTADTLKLMMSSEPPARARAATIISETLLDVGERESPDFWGSDLGAAMAREIGFSTPFPTRQIAAAVLRVTRQAVGQMIARRDLVGTDAGVDRLSLQGAALARWPREADITREKDQVEPV